MMWFAVDRDDRLVEFDSQRWNDVTTETRAVGFMIVYAGLVHRAIRAGEPLKLQPAGGVRVYVSDLPAAGGEAVLENPWIYFGTQPEGTRAVARGEVDRLRRGLVRFQATADGTYAKIEGEGTVRASELPAGLVARLARLSIAAADLERVRVDELGLVLPGGGRPVPVPVPVVTAPAPELLPVDVVGRRVAAAMMAVAYERDPSRSWMGRLSLSPRVQGWLEAVQADEPQQIVLIGLEAGPTLRSADPAVTRPIVAEWRGLIAELERVGGPMPKLHQLLSNFEMNIPR